MDDPLFDPWSADAGDSPAPPPAPGRWRAPSEPPRLPPARRDRTPPLPAPGARLAGTPGFLRSMAVPRLQEIALRLHLARHGAVVEDLLEASPPTVRLTVRPWRGPWSDDAQPIEGTLELMLEAGPEEHVVLDIWLDPEAGAPTEELRVPSAKLGAPWLESLALQFVKRALDRA